MSVFSQKNWKDNNRRVSIPLPARASHYLTLYSLAKCNPKSKIIRKLLDTWIGEEKKAGNNETKLVQDIAERLSLRWKIEKTNGSTFQDYKNIVKEELESKGVDHTYISLILIQIVK